MSKVAGEVISIREEINGDTGLDDRIADAFSSNLTSQALAALLREVEQTNIDAQALSKEAEARALDPKLRPAEVAEARRQMEDANFRSKRMEAAAEQLKELLAKTKAREEAEARRIEAEAATTERDQIIKDLEEYVELSGKIVTLLERLDANNRRLEKTGGWIDHAEPIARGAAQSMLTTYDERLPSLLSGVRLPKFRRDQTIHGYQWPRQQAW